MFQVHEEPINRLMETSQTLHGQLVRSPLWEMLKTEPVIISWIKALGDVEKEIKARDQEDPKLYGTKE